MIKESPPEEWLPVIGFEDYEISSHGRLRSYRRRKRAWRNPQSARKDVPTQVKGSVTKLGYVAHILRKAPGSKAVRFLAHRLVAMAFIENPQNHRDVCHNDGNPSNNHVTNLRWDSHKNNQLDMRRHGTMQDGEKCITAKLTEKEVMYIREYCAENGRGSGVVMAEKFALSVAQISRIINGHRWKYLHEHA